MPESDILSREEFKRQTVHGNGYSINEEIIVCKHDAALREALTEKDKELNEIYACAYEGETPNAGTAVQVILDLIRERDEWKARAERIHLLVIGSRMTECHIGPLFGAGWNGCIEHLVKQIAAIAAEKEKADA